MARQQICVWHNKHPISRHQWLFRTFPSFAKTQTKKHPRQDWLFRIFTLPKKEKDKTGSSACLPCKQKNPRGRAIQAPQPSGVGPEAEDQEADGRQLGLLHTGRLPGSRASEFFAASFFSEPAGVMWGAVEKPHGARGKTQGAFWGRWTDFCCS